jgi:hypothetical protein
MSYGQEVSQPAPLDIVRIERASFADLHDIGLENLATTDATVIDELDMKGYPKLLRYVEREFGNLSVADAEPARLRLASHAVFRALEQQYLLLAQLDYGRFGLTATAGMSPDVQKAEKTTGAPHIDGASMKLAGAITLNATFLTKGDWYWGLSSETLHITDKEAYGVVPEVKVPLCAPGVVILGEHARQDSYGDPCTVVHEVLSPEESWDSPLVQRVRSLHFRS